MPYDDDLGNATIDISAERKAGQLPVRFYLDTVKNAFKSEQAGRPIHEEVEFINITFPGDRTREIIREANDHDRRQYALEHARFKQLGEVAAVGTPLESWPILDRAMVADLKSLKILTVEVLAELNDAGIARCGPGVRVLVEKAKVFLNLAKDTALSQKQAAELVRRDDENKFLKDQLADLNKKFEGFQAAQGQTAPPKSAKSA